MSSFKGLFCPATLVPNVTEVCFALACFVVDHRPGRSAGWETELREGPGKLVTRAGYPRELHPTSSLDSSVLLFSR